MTKHSSTSEPIAIVGMACRLPGANDLDGFWNLLVHGKNAIGTIPESRFNRELYYDPRKGVTGRCYSDKAALVDISDAGTPGGCITAKDIADYAPAHILLCRVVEEAIRHSGIRPECLEKENVGLYLGHSSSGGLGSNFSYGLHIAQIAEYLLEDDSFDPPKPYTKESLAEALVKAVRVEMPWRSKDHNPHLLPGDMIRLVTTKFRLNGPGMVFNSACASSSQAIGHGMKALQLGRIDAAIVGGASYFLCDTIVLFSAAQSLSATGSHPFTNKADGLIPGEGYVVFLLKTLEKALRDGDQIHAVLSSVGISSDGGGASLWAPRKEGQIEAMKRAYDQGPGLASLDYIEGHATSTNLGDKTELTALSELLKEKVPVGKKIPIGSVKRNIGHTLEVAGAAGLLKTILAMKHETIPSTVDPSDTLSPNIPWNEIPLYPPAKNIPWPKHSDGTPRRAGVNAFGIGGLNIHMVVEDYVPTARPSAPVIPADPGDRAVAVIGVGLVLPGALDWQQFRSVLHDSRRRIKPLTKAPWNVAMFSDRKRWGDRAIDIPGGGVVEDFHYDWKRHKVPPKQLASASPLQFMMLDAVDQAIANAGYASGKKLDRMSTGCLVGTCFADDFATQLVMGLRLPETCRTLRSLIRRSGAAVPEVELDAWMKSFTDRVLKHMPALVDETGSFTASALASRITKTYNLMGGGGAVDAGIGASPNALIASIDMLLTGACKTMICIAGQQSYSPGAYQELALEGQSASAPDFAPPYDVAAKGSLPAEGCVALILKRLEDARSDGDPILGIIRGVGAAYKPERVNSVAESVTKALDDAMLPASSVTSIEGVGNGVAQEDLDELKGLESVYMTTSSSDAVLPVSTLVSRFGHFGAVAGHVSLIAGLAGLDEQTLPATLGFSQTDAQCAKRISLSDRPQGLVTHDPDGRLCMGVNVCSNFGASFHIILERPEPVRPAAPPKRAETIVQKTAVTGVEIISANVVHFDASQVRRERLKNIARKAASSEKRVPDKPVVPAPVSVKPPERAVLPPKLPIKITVLPRTE